MSVQLLQSELLEDLAIEQQELIAGGKCYKGDDEDDDKSKKSKEKRKFPIYLKGYVFIPESDD
ncbi:hypothetical protein [Cylindrospermum sp. FACHB-282]|uniref:hypothetical protein n=1 Tax=Cylindrospermum sp. FACHB-282 TaxID=2692794 RepID=UPI001686AC79|nr:hypothetical protein [Cylindrospermum sp. FACHB-282]MBD2386108.1 hypothetical protein [Cylindrospermum sp. FACHB-282]